MAREHERDQQEKNRGTPPRRTSGAPQEGREHHQAPAPGDAPVTGFYVRATERRISIRPRGGAWSPSERERAHYSSGSAEGPAGGRQSSGYRGEESGEFREPASHSRVERGYRGNPRPQAPRGSEPPGDLYGQSQHPRHAGLPLEMRAGEGDVPAPYPPQADRSGRSYEPGYEEEDWAPGGDASVQLGMAYGDYGARRDLQRRGRWQREPVLARDIMTRSPRTVEPGASLRDIARIMRDENTGIVPVCDRDGRLRGVVTDRDIVMRTLADREDPMAATAGDVMTDDVECVLPDEELRDVVHLMGSRQIRRIPVVERDDRLVGIISMADVATRADYDEDLQDALEDISARRSFWSRLFG